MQSSVKSYDETSDGVGSEGLLAFEPTDTLEGYLVLGATTTGGLAAGVGVTTGLVK